MIYKCRKLGAILCVVLALAMVVPAYAATPAEKPYLVPDSQVAQEVNGKQILTRVYRVKTAIDPQSLIVQALTVDGYDYTFTGITQDEEPQVDSKPVQVEVSQTSASENLADSIRLFPAEYLYDEGGYTGQLHLDPKSIVTQVTGTEQQGGTVNKSTTKTYTLPYNDPTLVPETVVESGKTMKLTNISWTEEEYQLDSSVPTQYVATATYSYSYTNYKEVPTEYTTTALYTGTASRPGESIYTYTLTYAGTPVTADHTAMIGGLVRGVAIAVAVVAAVLILIALLRYILSMFAKVQAQDEATGEYVKIQTVRIRQKAPVIELNMLKVPEARRYLITMRESCARRMRGKTILIQAGNETISHRVEAIYGKRYIINVDL